MSFQYTADEAAGEGSICPNCQKLQSIFKCYLKNREIAYILTTPSTFLGYSWLVVTDAYAKYPCIQTTQLVSHGRWKGVQGGARAFLDFDYLCFYNNVLVEKCFFHSFGLVKWNFVIANPHWKKTFCYSLEKLTITPTEQHPSDAHAVSTIKLLQEDLARFGFSIPL